MLTYTDILNTFLSNIGQDGSTDTTILNNFKLNLGNRYQMILSRMRDYVTQTQATASTVANQQYYHYPVGILNIESAVVTVGSVNYPTTVVNSQWQWDWLNAIQVQPTAIPQFIFPRKVDFGIYPIPQAAYTLTLNYHYRDRNLNIADYTTGTVAVTLNNQTVTGTNATFDATMVGEYFQVTDSTAPGQGYFYKISAVPSSSTLTLETGFASTSGSGLSYRIGQVPDFPEEGHIILVDGVTADFYQGMRHDIETATFFNNKFFTGDGNNNRRAYGDNTITGGLIGLYNMYADRNQEHIIDKKKSVVPFPEQVWGMVLS